MPQALRTALALFVSYFTLVVIVLICSLFTGRLLGLEPGHITRMYLAVNVLSCTVAGLIGGWLVAYIAGSKAMQHGALLAVVMLSFIVLGMAHPISGETMLYRVLLAVLMVLAVLAGAATERKA